MKATGLGDPSDTVKLEPFSDGVIAVALTLLALDLKEPEPEVHRTGHWDRDYFCGARDQSCR